MQILEKKLTEIRPYEKNPRNNTAAVDKVAASIREFGFKVPIVIDRDGIIVAGHTRFKAAGSLGLDTVPCIVADDLTEEQIKAFRLADNKTAEFASWIIEDLAAELQGIQEINMAAFGFDENEPENAEDIEEDEGFTDEQVTAHGIERGQIWQLGDHRLICGDASSKEDADALMEGDPAVFVFTDPPYGVAIGDKNKFLNEFGRGGVCETNIKGDTMDVDTLRNLLTRSMSNLREHCSEAASYYVSAPQGGELGMMMTMMMRDAGLPVRHNLIWVKSSFAFSLGRLDYDYRHEPIFYTWTKSHKFYGGYSNTVIDDTTPLEKMSKGELKDLVRALKSGREDSVIYCDKPSASRLHPTMKPIKLVGRFMINSSQKGDIVADYFGGSGTTLMAAQQLERKARLIEIDPHYVDVIISRWEEYTGHQAERIA